MREDDLKVPSDGGLVTMRVCLEKRGETLMLISRLIAKAHAPVVTGTRVVLGPGPAYGGRFSEYDYLNDTIYWMPWAGGIRMRTDLYHELGHAFDHKYLRDDHRAALMHFFGGKPRPWFWGDRSPLDENDLPEPYEEVFANAYERCCMYRLQQIRLRRFLRRVVREKGIHA